MKKPVQDVFNILDTIALAPYRKYQYNIYGNFESADPPAFIFMAKTPSARNSSAKTKILVTLYADDDSTKITLTTKTNPAYPVFTGILLLSLIICLFRITESGMLKNSLITLFCIILMVVIDRMAKNFAIAGFERDVVYYKKQ